MQSWQFWLLMFSLWYSLNIQVDERILNTFGVYTILLGVYGSFVMIFVSLIWS